MIQRSIAAFLLLTLGWMSVPVALGSVAAGTMHLRHRDASPAQNHSCCPRPGVRRAPVLSVVVSLPAMPCSPQHPCCLKQKPASPSNIPVQSTITRPAAERAIASSVERASPDYRRVVESSLVCCLLSPLERGTILRI